jgi:hypothetical protein
MVVVPTTFLTSVCAKLFGGVKPEMRLSPDDIETLKPEVKRVYRSIRLRLFLIAGAFALVAAAIFAARMYLDGPSANAILDDRVFIGSMSAGLVAGIGLCFCFSSLQPVLARRAFGESAHLFDSYLATESNWLPRRAAWFWGILCAPLIAVGCLGTFGLGDRVDDNGIIECSALFPRRHAYSDVASVMYYQSFVAPIGPRQVPNIFVKFKDGTDFQYNNDDNKRNPHPLTVGTLIATRANLTMGIGGQRPK